MHFLIVTLVSLRLKSIKNIQKITKSMKMVAAAKFGKAEKDLQIVRPYGTAASSKSMESRACTYRGTYTHYVIYLGVLF